MSAFDNATLMITGGTGSFGSTVLKHFLDSDLKEIRIFSRDEKKQDDMRHELQAKHPENAKKRLSPILCKPPAWCKENHQFGGATWEDLK